MNVTVQIHLGQNEYASDLAGNATELAEKILSAIGGDEDKDSVSVNISDSGSAGTSSLGAPTPEPPSTNSIVVNSTFATNNSSPPGDKQTRTNAAALSDVSTIYVDNHSSEGDDISTQLLPLVVGDQVELRGVADSTRYGIFTLNAAPINQGTFVELSVDFVEAGSALTNSACTLTVPTRL